MPTKQQRDALGAFLRSRREALRPEDTGLAKSATRRPDRRQTPGLRREEVAELAELASLSVSWYTRLEQGHDVQLSAKALRGVADALQLSKAERDYLFTLALDDLDSANPSAPAPAPAAAPAPAPAPPEVPISGTLRAVLDGQGDNPAYLVDACLNLLAWNRAANVVFGAGVIGDLGDLPPQDRNLLWLIFSDESRRRFVNWERHARLLLAQFRDASRHLVGDPWIEALIARLEAHSPEFVAWWSLHDVERVQETEKVLHHPAVGQVALRQTVLQVFDDTPGLFLILYTPAPGTDAAEKLQKLSVDTG
jgi:transcriptional regulator with XRE-family HTH domain